MGSILATVWGLLLACGFSAVFAQAPAVAGEAEPRGGDPSATTPAVLPDLIDPPHDSASLRTGGHALAPDHHATLQPHATAHGSPDGLRTVRGLVLDPASSGGDARSRGLDRAGQTHTGEDNGAFAGQAHPDATRRRPTSGNSGGDGLGVRLRTAVATILTADTGVDVSGSDGDEPERWAQAAPAVSQVPAVRESRRHENRMDRHAGYPDVRERPPQPSAGRAPAV